MHDLENILVIDTESNGLRNPTDIHVICTRTLDGETREFRQPVLYPEVAKEFVEYAKGFSTYVGQNIIPYDIVEVLDRLIPDNPVTWQKSIDMLVVSRLLKYGLKGGHSIQAWGDRFHIKKIGTEIDQWDTLTEIMVERCHSDTLINLKVFEKYKKYLEQERWESPLATEHEIAYICAMMSRDGFAFDLMGAKRLYFDIDKVWTPINENIGKTFPPRVVPRREVTPRYTKDGAFNMNDFRWYDGEDLSIFNGGPFTVIDFEPFNPRSPMQVVGRLNEAGWKPTEKTKGHQEILRNRDATKEQLDRFAEFGWKVSEENLKTLPDDAPQGAKDLAKWTLLQSRLDDLNEWMELVEKEGNEYVVHGSFNGIGAWTHRLSHSKPNLANVPVAKRSPKDNEFETLVNDYNDAMRGLWVARKGHRLIGTDADGIQMRVFAHIVNDEDLIYALLHGSKEDETDIHNLHKRKLGDACKSRDTAKTFIYAWLLGAGLGKVAEILECSQKEAKQAVANFIESYPGLAELKRTIIPRDASRGYFTGLDGRLVAQDSEHLMLAGYLQNGEAIIMKRACIQWYNKLKKEKIPFRMCTWPHDEWQTEIPDDDDLCKYVQEAQIEAIRAQGPALDMRLPLDGSSDWGYSWKDTH